MKLTKKRKAVQGKVDSNKLYTLNEASKLVKETTTCKFDASVDLHVELGVDPKKADQAIRGTTALPHGTGKTKRVLVLTTADKEEEAKKAGADYVGLDEFVQKIEQGWMDFEVVIATPNVMAKIAKLGKVLGPRNLMPNPKVGTVTMDVAGAVKGAKGGAVEFRVEKAGILHAGVGKASFTEEALLQNIKAFADAVQRAKPAGAKGTYVKRVAVSSTMGPGVHVDPASVNG